MEFQPAYVLDLADQVLNLGFILAHARESGMELQQQFAQLITVRDGLVARERGCFAWEEGLRAAGLELNDVPSLGMGSSSG